MSDSPRKYARILFLFEVDISEVTDSGEPESKLAIKSDD